MKVRVRKKFNIFEGIDDYYVGFYENIPHPCPGGVVGKVMNRFDNKIQVPIVVDDEEIEKNGCGPCVYDGDHENVLESAIFMTNEFFDEFRNNKILSCALWHEIGHFHTFRYFENKHDENGSATTIRGEYIKRGEILPEEKGADLFALYYTSKERMVEFYNYEIKKHRNKEITGLFSEEIKELKEINEMTIRELCSRKRYISELDCSKENILKELCKVCGIKGN